MSSSDSSSQLGKYFIWIAWVIVLALLVFFFEEQLNQQFNPNSQPQSYLNNAGKAEVVLQQNRYGHYLVDGQINQLPVTFLLDTGATQVSIPAHIAEQLNLTVTGQGYANTANGTTKIYYTQVQQLNIGNIYLYDVNAHINPSMKTNEILLGMSALKRVEFSQTGKQLTLREIN